MQGYVYMVRHTAVYSLLFLIISVIHRFNTAMGRASSLLCQDIQMRIRNN